MGIIIRITMKKTFSDRVIEAALSVPAGRVTTYGDIARACGGGGQAARSITGILGRAYKKGQTGIPFHRIVYSDGRVWKSKDYDKARAKLYKTEGIIINEKGYIDNFLSKRWEF